MNSKKRKNKGGRPVKGAAEKLKYRVTVKNGNGGLLSVEVQGQVGRSLCQ